METHVKLISVLYIIFGLMWLGGGLLIFFIMAGAGAVSQDRTAFFITGGIGLTLAICALLISLPSFIAAFGLLKHREWARILTIVLSAFHLLAFPVGTALGGFSIWALVQPETEALFTSPSRV